MKGIHPASDDIHRQLHVLSINARAIADAPGSLQISLAAAGVGLRSTAGPSSEAAASVAHSRMRCIRLLKYLLARVERRSAEGPPTYC